MDVCVENESHRVSGVRMGGVYYSGRYVMVVRLKEKRTGLGPMGTVRYLWSLRLNLACTSKRSLKRDENQFGFIRVRVTRRAYMDFTHRFSLYLCSRLRKLWICFVGSLSGGQAVSVADQGRAGAVDEAASSDRQESLAWLTIAVR